MSERPEQDRLEDETTDALTPQDEESSADVQAEDEDVVASVESDESADTEALIEDVAASEDETQSELDAAFAAAEAGYNADEEAYAEAIEKSVSQYLGRGDDQATSEAQQGSASVSTPEYDSAVGLQDADDATGYEEGYAGEETDPGEGAGYPPAVPPRRSPSWQQRSGAWEPSVSMRPMPAYEDAPGLNFRRAIIFAVTLLAIGATLWFMHMIRVALIPFAVALLLAYLVSPIVTMLNQLINKRAISVVITVALLVIIGGGIMTQLGPAMGSQSADLLARLNAVWTDIQGSIEQKQLNRRSFPPEGQLAHGKTTVGWQEFVAAWREYVETGGSSRQQEFARMRGRIDNTILGGAIDNMFLFVSNRSFDDVFDRAGRLVFSSGWAALGFASFVIFGLGLAIAIATYSVTLATVFPSAKNLWNALIPPDLQERISGFFDEFSAAMNQHFVRQAVVAMIIGALFCVAFTAIKLPIAIPMGVVCGLLAMVPFLKVAMLAPAIVVAAFHAFDKQQPVLQLVALTIAVFVAIQVFAELMKIFILKRPASQERLAILLGFFVFGALLGPLGILLAIPLTCIFIAWYRNLSNYREAQQELHLAAA